MIFQSIQTRYLGPTNYRPSRIVATTAYGQRLIMPYDSELSVVNNHRAAADAICVELAWPKIKAGGSTKDGYAWIMSTFEGE